MNALKKIFFLIVFLLQLVSFQSCLRSTRSTDTFITEQGEGGFTEIVLFNGDTLCVPEHLRNRENAPKRKGMIIHFHIADDSLRDFFAEEETGIIHPHVHEYVKDSSFMLIDQKPLDSILGKYIRIYYTESNYYSIREHDTVDNIDDLFLMIMNSNIHCYWIICVKTADVYGPYSYNDYMAKKKELGVPEQLKLTCEELN